MDFVSLEKRGHIAVVTLNRPPVNALNQQTYAEIRECFQAINRDDDVWVAILRAEGNVFSAGNDLVGDNPSNTRYDSPYVQNVNTSIRSVFECRVPLIGMCQGKAIGAGFSMLSACDIVVASPEAGFSIPEAKVGLVGGASAAAFSLPQKMVRYLALTGAFITAEELRHVGFLHKIVPREELFDTAMEIAKIILKNPPLGMRATKVSLGNVFHTQRQLGMVPMDRVLSYSLSDTEDREEALRAFLEKRTPNYQGK